MCSKCNLAEILFELTFLPLASIQSMQDNLFPSHFLRGEEEALDTLTFYENQLVKGLEKVQLPREGLGEKNKQAHVVYSIFNN